MNDKSCVYSRFYRSYKDFGDLARIKINKHSVKIGADMNCPSFQSEVKIGASTDAKI